MKFYSRNAICLIGNLDAWFIHEQHVVIVSSIEADYSVVDDACKDSLNIYHFLSEFIQLITPISTHMDNQGAMWS